MDKLWVIKIGGNIIDDEEKLDTFLNDFSRISGHKILLHGGGKLATRLAEQLNLPQQMVGGRRITDAETLKVVTMVYAGYINKTIVAHLQSHGCNAVGLTGADGNAVLAHKRVRTELDYGFAGDIDVVNASFLKKLLDDKFSPVIAPITHDKKGQLLNTNADTMAQEIARALCSFFEVQLIYSFEKSGVLLDVHDDTSVVKKLTPNYYRELKEQGVIFAGMIPKLDNAFKALATGIHKVFIGKAEEISEITTGNKGTSICND